MREAEYRRLRAKLISDHQRDLEALDRVFSLSGGDPDAVAKADRKDAGKSGRVDRGALSRAIDDVLPGFAIREFTASEIHEEVQRRHPELDLKESSVSSALVRLVEGD